MSSKVPERVVSLLPAATEMVFALGCGERLVGRSHACDHPWAAVPIPAVTRTVLAPDASSAELHQAVTNSPKADRSLFQIDRERLRALRPDLILSQDLCAVCAVSPADLESALADWPGPRPQVIHLAPGRFADLWTDLRRVALALGLADEGRATIAPLKARVVAVIERVALVKNPPTVACLEWLDPLMGAGNWIPELVQLAGGHPVFGEAGRHSDWITWENLLLQDPDVLVAMPCGFDLDRVRREVSLLARRPGWERLRAVRSGRVFVTDASSYFNRPGPRLVDSLEILGELLHPESFSPARHHGDGWQAWADTNAGPHR